MGYSSCISQVFCKKPAPVAAPVRAPATRSARQTHLRAGVSTEDRLTRTSPARIPTSMAGGQAYAVKQLQRTLAMYLSERGDNTWRLGDAVKALSLLHPFAAGLATQAVAQPHAALLTSYETLMQRLCADVAEALTYWEAVHVPTRGGAAGIEAVNKTAFAQPVIEARALVHAYGRVCAQLPAAQLQKLCATLRTHRGQQARVVAMPAMTSLRASFAPEGVSATQRRLKEATVVALKRLQACCDGAYQASSQAAFSSVSSEISVD